MLSYYTPRRRLGESRYSSYSFSTSAQDWGEWSASRPGRTLAPGKGSPVHSVQEAGWASEPVWTQKLEEKSFRLCRGSNLDRPARSQILYCLSYPAPSSSLPFLTITTLGTIVEWNTGTFRVRDQDYFYFISPYLSAQEIETSSLTSSKI
jgi:hypothetical protein